MRAELSNRLSRLNEKRFVVFEFTQQTNDCIESFPASRGATSSAVDHQLIGIFRDFGIEIVHQHPHRRFLMPAFARAFITTRRLYNSFSTHELIAPQSKSPRRMASATWAISPESG